MSRWFVVAGLLCICACSAEKDTKSTNVWPVRTIEPQLSGMDHQRCCTAPDANLPPTECDEIRSHDDALRMLSLYPKCTDASIAALANLSRSDPAARSDLSAAYFARAQRDQRSSDYLRAIEEAEHAAAFTPVLPAALFNRSLTYEVLGLKDEATASWNAFLRTDADSSWKQEARRHLAVLQQRIDGATLWADHRKQLDGAISAGDAALIDRLIAPFPATAQNYLDEELLAQWADAPSVQNLARAKTLAAALSSHAGDSYAMDEVNAIRDTPELRSGYQAYRTAKREFRAFHYDLSIAAYRRAADALGRGGSPLRAVAELEEIVGSAFTTAPASLLPRVDAIEQEARRRHHRYVLVRARAIRAFLLYNDNRYLEALTEYDAARQEAVQLHDPETVATIDIRRLGLIRILGDSELAFRTALETQRSITNVVEPRSWHLFMGETAAVALELGYPRVAHLYQTAVIDNAGRQLTSTSPARREWIDHWLQQLAIGHNKRASIRVHLEDFTGAQADLAEAVRLLRNRSEEDRNNARVLAARIEEVRGQVYLRLNNPTASIRAFTRALTSSEGSEYLSFRAGLFAQRAEAQRMMRNPGAAEADLRLALDELHKEETGILQHRRRGSGEEFWSPYFSRFQPTYHRLMRLLADERRIGEAFAIAERARAFEPLNLLRQLPDLPSDFRALTEAGQTMDLSGIRKELPEDTYLLQYAVLDDRTYTWIVGRNEFELLTQPVRREEVERWSEELQSAVRRRDELAVDRGLYAPFERLVRKPFERVRTLARGREPRLVFIPDGAMHGLPFSALRDSGTKRFLVQDAIVSNAASATLYMFSLRRDAALSHARTARALLLGDPAFDMQLVFARGLERLPGAKREVEQIRQFYEPNVEVLLDVKATVPEFLKYAPESMIVHVAGHAIVNPRSPFRSLLLLARSGRNDGALEARELLTRLTLDRTKLVVLSSCSSAGGLPVGPEGVGPLVRPLMTAGAPAVIGSLWNVGDATAEDLLVSFHRHYRQGSDAAGALRAAQLELLGSDNPGLRSVIAWAPFQVIGYASSPFGSPVHKGEPP